MICLTCGYETEDKSNYNKHLMTNKHLWYLTNSSDEKRQDLIEKNGYYKCPHCKYLTTRSDNLKRHISIKHSLLESEKLIDLMENDEENKNEIEKEEVSEQKNNFKGNKLKKKKNMINLN